MNLAAYIASLVRPDLAGFREVRKRHWSQRLFYWGNRDERLRQLFSHAPYSVSEAEWFMEAALEWVHDYILPVYQGDHDLPQSAAQTLEELAGDCEDGAILLGSMIVSGLEPEAWACAKLCVGTVDGQRQHAFLEWDRTDRRDTVLLDWTVSSRPLGRNEISWSVESAAGLG